LAPPQFVLAQIDEALKTDPLSPELQYDRTFALFHLALTRR
jgi:hypothetical protein